ncbi:MAG: nitroreductase family protein [Bacteroidales bacterium]|nr:nitroreductase family protein [Bacteroidales bacterium]
MKKRTLTLVVATAIFATGIFSSCNQKTTEPEAEPVEVDTASIVLDKLMTRTSIRKYQETPVEDAVIEKILRAGMAAPSARNAQPWSFGVVKDRALLQQIAETNPNAGMCAEAPMAIVVCGDVSKMLDGLGRDFWIDDCSAATENILLAAHALGLGAVWTGFYPNMERVNALRPILNIPEDQIVLCVIPMGYPAESPAPKDKWKPENIHYDRW